MKEPRANDGARFLTAALLGFLASEIGVPGSSEATESVGADRDLET